MARLRETSPLDDALPIEVEGCRLTAWAPGTITSIMPFRGQEAALGFPFPGPGEITSHDGGQIIWTGRGQAMALAVTLATDGAALTDQSDGWSGMRLDGPLSTSVLARLCPVDLREAAFPAGGTLRTMLQHVPVILIRDDVESFRMLVFRSMSVTAIHDVSTAMKHVAAQHV